ncbi:MAG: CRTAC1 family protein, partial [Phycisphaerae bacterium]
FEDRTVEADLQIPLPPRIDDITIPFRGGISAGDLNHDGYLDLFVTMWNGKSQLLYNNRDGTFTDATATANVNTALHYGHQPALFDFDGDGLLDIYLAVDFLWNALYLNNGDQTFTDHAAEVRLDNAMNDMGMALGDIDNDGDFDIYITNIFQPFQYNVLYRNDSVPGRMSFTEIAQASGADYGGWGWGATFLDADNDGRLDIAATNGWETPTFQFDKSVFYHNRLGRQIKFDDVSASVGFNDNEWGSGLIALDVDRDGDLDLMQTCNNGPLRLLINHQSRLADRRNHLTVKPRMKGNNHFAIGAVVRIETEELTTVRLIHAGTSFMSQEPAEAVFGLGKQTSVKRLQITWPDGSRSEYVDVPANQVLVVEHAGDGDLDADNDIDHHDFRRMTQCVNTIDSPTQCRPADLNHDHATDLKDIVHFQNRMQIQTP